MPDALQVQVLSGEFGLFCGKQQQGALSPLQRLVPVHGFMHDTAEQFSLSGQSMGSGSATCAINGAVIAPMAKTPAKSGTANDLHLTFIFHSLCDYGVQPRHSATIYTEGGGGRQCGMGKFLLLTSSRSWWSTSTSSPAPRKSWRPPDPGRWVSRKRTESGYPLSRAQHGVPRRDPARNSKIFILMS